MSVYGEGENGMKLFGVKGLLLEKDFPKRNDYA